MTTTEHIENIKKHQNDIADETCPYCGGHLILRNCSLGQFYGCENYPKCMYTKDYK